MTIVRITEKTPTDFRRRMLSYRTRRMRANDLPEDHVDLDMNVAAAFIKAGYAEVVAENEPAKRGPGRPKKTESQSQPASSKPKQGQPYLTRAQLLNVAEKRGVELPPGYVTRDELAALIGDVSSDEVAEAGG